MPFPCNMCAGPRAQAELRKYHEDPSLAVGKLLTVQFQGYTNKSGVQRFPVALRIRE